MWIVLHPLYLAHVFSLIKSLFSYFSLATLVTEKYANLKNKTVMLLQTLERGYVSTTCQDFDFENIFHLNLIHEKSKYDCELSILAKAWLH